MKSKSIITLLICLSSFQLVKAQFGYDFQWIDRSPNPNTTVSFQPVNIASDFGRREFGSKFHDGVDFSGDGGDDDLGLKLNQ